MRKFINSIRKWIVRFLLRLVRNYFECYVVNIENTNQHEAKAVLFGHNLFCSAENFGSDNGVKVETPYSSYEQLLYESQLKTVIKKMRVLGDSVDIGKKILTFCQKYASGRMCSTPIILGQYFSELQVQENIIDVDRLFMIDGSAYLEFNMKPNEKITFIFFGDKVNVYEASSRNN